MNGSGIQILIFYKRVFYSAIHPSTPDHYFKPKLTDFALPLSALPLNNCLSNNLANLGKVILLVTHYYNSTYYIIDCHYSSRRRIFVQPTDDHNQSNWLDNLMIFETLFIGMEIFAIILTNQYWTLNIIYDQCYNDYSTIIFLDFIYYTTSKLYTCDFYAYITLYNNYTNRIPY